MTDDPHGRHDSVHDSGAAAEIFATPVVQAVDQAKPPRKFGCTPKAMFIALLLAIIAGTAATLINSVLKDDPVETAEPSGCGSASAEVGDVEVQPISVAQGCPNPNFTTTTAAAETTTTVTPVASDSASPPSPDELPDGAILVQGSSAGPIGCIACDGRHRFLSVVADGVSVDDMTSVATTWQDDGVILEFGARLSAPNVGTYGINFFYADTSEYGPGVPLAPGQQSNSVDYLGQDGAVEGLRPVVIIVGEAGNIEANGAYSLDWWFVFQPDD